MNQHTFEISSTVNPDTQKPFGEQYAGNFTVRRPTIKDNANIALAFTAATSKSGGTLNPIVASNPAISQLYVFCLVGAIAESKPAWFDENNLFEEDEAAVYAVHEEVERWLSTFRPETNSTAGIQRGGNSSVLVQEQI